MKLFFSFLSIFATFFLSACMHKPMEVKPTVANDCTVLTPSFQKDIQPIFKLTCAKSGCHDGLSMPYDFSIYNELTPVLADSALYYYVIKDRSMPQDEPLDSTQYHLVKCWLSNGFPNN